MFLGIMISLVYQVLNKIWKENYMWIHLKKEMWKSAIYDNQSKFNFRRIIKENESNITTLHIYPKIEDFEFWMFRNIHSRYVFES